MNVAHYYVSCTLLRILHTATYIAHYYVEILTQIAGLALVMGSLLVSLKRVTAIARAHKLDCLTSSRHT